MLPFQSNKVQIIYYCQIVMLQFIFVGMSRINMFFSLGNLLALHTPAVAFSWDMYVKLTIY